MYGETKNLNLTQSNKQLLKKITPETSAQQSLKTRALPESKSNNKIGNLKRDINALGSFLKIGNITLELTKPVTVWSWSRSFFSPRMQLTFKQFLLDMVDMNPDKAEDIFNSLSNIDKLTTMLGKHRNWIHFTTTTGMDIYNQLSK